MYYQRLCIWQVVLIMHVHGLNKGMKVTTLYKTKMEKRSYIRMKEINRLVI